MLKLEKSWAGLHESFCLHEFARVKKEQKQKQRRGRKRRGTEPHTMLRRIRSRGVEGAGWRVVSDKRGNGSRGHVLKRLEFHARQCVLYLTYNEGFKQERHTIRLAF